jgi:hypothetical protein
MTRYTVTTTPKAEDELARLWMNATDRSAVARAADEIDRMLRDDASSKGDEIGSGLRQLTVGPLVAEFAISDPDRIVTIWSFRHVGQISNGR